MTRIFLSGPMTGIEGYNKKAFDIAEKILSDKGHTVLSPANTIPLTNPEEISHDGYIRICKAMIDECDYLVMLPGWEESKGALEEKRYAGEHDKFVCQDTDVNDAIKALDAIPAKGCHNCRYGKGPYNATTCDHCELYDRWEPIEPEQIGNPDRVISDPIESPAHYNHGGIETIDIIRSMLTADEYRGYLKGNILKYRERAPYKGKTDEDYAKAKKYHDWLMEVTQ